MHIPITRRILRFIDPTGERQRMEMRHIRCMAEANAEDLTRTVSMNAIGIMDAMDEYKANMKHIRNGG